MKLIKMVAPAVLVQNQRTVILPTV